MFCPNCGSQIEDGAKFCPECGAPLQPAEPEVTAVPPVPEDIPEPEDAAEAAYAPVLTKPSFSPDVEPEVAPEPAQEQAPDLTDDGNYKLRIQPAAIIAYLFGIVGFAISYWLGNRENEYLHFHLNQALVFAILEIIAYGVSRISSGLGSLLDLIIFILWIIAFVGVCKKQMKKAPLIGEIKLLK